VPPATPDYTASNGNFEFNESIGRRNQRHMGYKEQGEKESKAV